MKNFRNLNTDDLDQYMKVYLNAYPAFKTLDQEGRTHYRNRILKDMTMDRDVDFIGLFEEEKLIALMKIVHFSMNIYGKMQKATGLMSLAVHPLYKKQGAAFEMVKYFEEYSIKKGSNIFALLPFNIPFYRQMGYGLGGKMDEYHISTKNLPKCKDLSHLAFIEEDQKEAILTCHSAFAHKRHGMFQKFDEEKRALLNDTETIHIGYFSKGILSSYASYHIEANHSTNYTQTKIVVDELIYQNSLELRTLLGYFANQADLAQEIIIRSGEEDFYHILDDPQDLSFHFIPFGYLQTNVSAMANMYKIQDFESFVLDNKQRVFPYANLVLAIEAFNEISKEVETYKIEFLGSQDKLKSSWTPSNKEPQVTLRANKGDLSALFLNSIGLRSLIKLGIGQLQPIEYLETLDQIFYYPEKPYSNSDY